MILDNIIEFFIGFIIVMLLYLALYHGVTP